MIISCNWLKKFVQIDTQAEELAKEIGAKLVEVEAVIDLGIKYQGVVVARVKSVEPLAGSDHLSLCKIDDGGFKQEIERDENGWIQVVCGAPNVRVDANVAWIVPGAVVPASYGSQEEFKLDSRKLMGQVSHGMLASARELALWDEHEGILLLDENLAPGTSFAQAYELNDFLFDIENKSLTQRPDCFGIIGFAREVAAILGQEFKSPDWLLAEIKFTTSNLKIQVAEAGLASAYYLAEVDDLEQVPVLSLLDKTYLARVGVRPLSPIVDWTNYLMMLTAQPLHAFDRDKLEALSAAQGLDQLVITLRLARAGEKFRSLDGRDLVLSDKDIVIAVGETVVALAGAIGGSNSEIDASTKRVLLEAASFDLYKLRTTQMRHGIFSEALTRFTKGQPAALAAPVLARATQLLAATSVKVVQADLAVGINPCIELDLDFVNQVLGTNLSLDAMRQSLINAEFKVQSIDNKLLVVAPFWRNDVTTPIELVEELGRVYGYDNIVPSLPERQAVAVEAEKYDKFLTKMRNYLSQAGANEVLTYSFVNQALLRKSGQDPSDSYRLINSISPDLELCRQTLQPSLLNLIYNNLKAGFTEFALYEINKTQLKSHGLNDEAVPIEQHNLALVLAKKSNQNTAYFLAKRYLEFLLTKFDLVAEYKPLESSDAMSIMFEPKRSALVEVAGCLIGVLGEYKQSVKKNFKLPDFSAGWELDLVKLFKLWLQANHYKTTTLAKFPSVERAICFETSLSLNFDQLKTAFLRAIAEQDLSIKLRTVDLFKTDDFKRTTFALTISNPNKTLTSDEAQQILDQIITSMSKWLDFKVV